MIGFLEYFWDYRDEVMWLTREHIAMTVTALGVAFLISVPLGIVASRYRRLQFIILWLAGLGQTVPSLALLGLLMPLLGIGFPLADRSADRQGRAADPHQHVHRDHGGE